MRHLTLTALKTGLFRLLKAIVVSDQSPGHIPGDVKGDRQLWMNRVATPYSCPRSDKVCNMCRASVSELRLPYSTWWRKISVDYGYHPLGLLPVWTVVQYTFTTAM